MVDQKGSGVWIKSKVVHWTTWQTHWSFVRTFQFWYKYFIFLMIVLCFGEKPVLACICSWSFLSGSDLLTNMFSDSGAQTGSCCFGTRNVKTAVVAACFLILNKSFERYKNCCQVLICGGETSRTRLCKFFHSFAEEIYCFLL